ncbi:hypothetical protein EVAR_7248_1 [Eumeta japonica]|uniref:Uncharacterized protein n=1 Tax=Eumeta variegata TaxID=151549 RepID=A0A4C1T3D1_EUMVA|nr:hypothetical protein EVAR_7248_1 [Eumeta japonica]
MVVNLLLDKVHTKAVGWAGHDLKFQVFKYAKRDVKTFTCPRLAKVNEELAGGGVHYTVAASPEFAHCALFVVPRTSEWSLDMRSLPSTCGVSTKISVLSENGMV